jgi:oligoendopeptidase F
MQNEAVVPARLKTNYLAENFRFESWDDLEPLFEELLHRELSSATQLKQWIRDLSEVEAILSEETGWRYIRMNIDTTNEAYAKAFEMGSSTPHYRLNTMAKS